MNSASPPFANGMFTEAGTTEGSPRLKSEPLMIYSQSRIRPEMIPRPTNIAVDRTQPVAIVNTVINGTPPSATSVFSTNDTGSASSRYMRLSTGQVARSPQIAALSHVPFILAAQPFADPAPSEREPPTVNLLHLSNPKTPGAIPPRCPRCKTYVNSFMEWVDVEGEGKGSRCNMCNFKFALPPAYVEHVLNPSLQTPSFELSMGTVDFLAPPEFSANPPTTPCLIFLLDASRSASDAITGALRNALYSIRQVISYASALPSLKTRVGIVTYDHAVTFWAPNTNDPSQPKAFVMNDVLDPFCGGPPGEVLVRVHASKIAGDNDEETFNQIQLNNIAMLALLDHLEAKLTNSSIISTAANAALSAAVDLAASVGCGHIIQLACTPPLKGLGAVDIGRYLQPHANRNHAIRKAQDTIYKAQSSSTNNSIHPDVEHQTKILNALLEYPDDPSTLQPQNRQFLKSLYQKCEEHSVGISVLVCGPQNDFMDLADLHAPAHYSGGRAHFIPNFWGAKHAEELHANIIRAASARAGYGCVVRLRCSVDIDVKNCLGSFSLNPNKTHSRDFSMVKLPRMDSDASLSFHLEIKNKIQQACSFNISHLPQATYSQTASNSGNSNAITSPPTYGGGVSAATTAIPVFFQLATLYVDQDGISKLRVQTLMAPSITILNPFFKSCDVDVVVAHLAKCAAIALLNPSGSVADATAGLITGKSFMAVSSGSAGAINHSANSKLNKEAAQLEEAPSHQQLPLNAVRDDLISLTVEILHSYRQNCSATTYSNQFVLPESLKLLPAYLSALFKQPIFRLRPGRGLGTSAQDELKVSNVTYLPSLDSPVAPRLDERLFLLQQLLHITPFQLAFHLYPRIFPFYRSFASTRGKKREFQGISGRPARLNDGSLCTPLKTLLDMNPNEMDTFIPPFSEVLSYFTPGTIAASGSHLAVDGVYVFDRGDSFIVFVGSRVGQEYIDSILHSYPIQYPPNNINYNNNTNSSNNNNTGIITSNQANNNNTFDSNTTIPSNNNNTIVGVTQSNIIPNNQINHHQLNKLPADISYPEVESSLIHDKFQYQVSNQIPTTNEGSNNNFNTNSSKPSNVVYRIRADTIDGMRLTCMIEQLRRDKCQSEMRLYPVRVLMGGTMEEANLMGLLVEDPLGVETSYADFLCAIHHQVLSHENS